MARYRVEATLTAVQYVEAKNVRAAISEALANPHAWEVDDLDAIDEDEVVDVAVDDGDVGVEDVG